MSQLSTYRHFDRDGMAAALQALTYGVPVRQHHLTGLVLGDASIGAFYSTALDWGLVTQAQYDAARAAYGDRWNVCG